MEQNTISEPYFDHNIKITRHAHSFNNIFLSKGLKNKIIKQYNKKTDPSLSLWGLISAIKMAQDISKSGINQTHTNTTNTEYIFVSSLVRTWITAFILYINSTNKNLYLIVSPYLKEKDIRSKLGKKISKLIDYGNFKNNTLNQVYEFLINMSKIFIIGVLLAKKNINEFITINNNKVIYIYFNDNYYFELKFKINNLDTLHIDINAKLKSEYIKYYFNIIKKGDFIFTIDTNLFTNIHRNFTKKIKRRITRTIKRRFSKNRIVSNNSKTKSTNNFKISDKLLSYIDNLNKINTAYNFDSNKQMKTITLLKSETQNATNNFTTPINNQNTKTINNNNNNNNIKIEKTIDLNKIHIQENNINKSIDNNLNISKIHNNSGIRNDNFISYYNYEFYDKYNIFYFILWLVNLKHGLYYIMGENNKVSYYKVNNYTNIKEAFSKGATIKCVSHSNVMDYFLKCINPKHEKLEENMWSLILNVNIHKDKDKNKDEISIKIKKTINGIPKNSANHILSYKKENTLDNLINRLY